jgi:nucleotide-binding universal stress UspA family protein
LGEARVAELERHLGELVPNREDHTILARPHFVESDALVPAILHAAERLTVDAVVMVAHRKHGLKHALTGSTVEHVFREANKPVVIVPLEGA